MFICVYCYSNAFIIVTCMVLYTGGWTRSQYYEWMAGFDQLLWWWDYTDNTTSTSASSSGSRLIGSPLRGQQQRADGSRNITNNNNNNSTSVSASGAVDTGLLLSCLTKLIAYDPIVSNIQSLPLFINTLHCSLF